MAINSVNISGRLTANPELKYTTSQKAVVSLSIATDVGYGDQKRTIYPEVQAWTHTAEFIADYAKKGQEIMITGRYDEQTWDDKETGKKRRKAIIVASDVVLGRLPRGEETSAPAQQTRRRNSEPAPQGFEHLDEDIPF